MLAHKIFFLFFYCAEEQIDSSANVLCHTFEGIFIKFFSPQSSKGERTHSDECLCCATKIIDE